jgi:hypothetical protein
VVGKDQRPKENEREVRFLREEERANKENEREMLEERKILKRKSKR